MKLTKATFLAAFTAAGLIACGQAFAQDSTPNAPANMVTNAAPRMARGFNMDRITKQLNLTDDQKAKVQPILESWRTNVTSVIQDTSLSRQDRMTKLKSLHDDVTAQLKPILSDDQMATWQKMTQFRQRRPAMTPPANPPAGQ